MDIALDEARLAADRREVPVGAVIVKNGKILARAGNRTRENHDPSAHAEVLAIRAACAEPEEDVRDPDTLLQVVDLMARMHRDLAGFAR
ncbi:MAG: nucleoside deaminase, partial [Rhodobacteraceae bacterium]|nr:nucleoside deaminase [Paracoccaceae bacterium]